MAIIFFEPAIKLCKDLRAILQYFLTLMDKENVLEFNKEVNTDDRII